MAEYYTLETVKQQLLKAGGVIDIDYSPRDFPENWKYCPCVVIKSCKKQNKVICQPPIFIGIYIKPPLRGIPIVLEIIYERETKKGFVRANNRKLDELINKEKIDRNRLRKVTMHF